MADQIVLINASQKMHLSFPVEKLVQPVTVQPVFELAYDSAKPLTPNFIAQGRLSEVELAVCSNLSATFWVGMQHTAACPVPHFADHSCFSMSCRQQLLDEMPPFQGGGEMIENVYLDHSTYGPAPCRFEAGTPMIAEAIGLGAAVDYLSSIGMENVHDHERELGGYLYDRVSLSPSSAADAVLAWLSQCRVSSQDCCSILFAIGQHCQACMAGACLSKSRALHDGGIIIVMRKVQ